MPEKNRTTPPLQDSDENTMPSEYVRLEAELITDNSPARNTSRKKTILVYCCSHQLLMEISDDLKALFEPDVQILISTDKAVACRLLESGKIDLLLQGPKTEEPDSAFNPFKDESGASIGSSLVMMHRNDPVIESWMKSRNHSKHLANAVIRLNSG